MDSYLKVLEICIRQMQNLKENKATKEEIKQKANLAKEYIDILEKELTDGN